MARPGTRVNGVMIWFDAALLYCSYQSIRQPVKVGNQFLIHNIGACNVQSRIFIRVMSKRRHYNDSWSRMGFRKLLIKTTRATPALLRPNNGSIVGESEFQGVQTSRWDVWRMASQPNMEFKRSYDSVTCVFVYCSWCFIAPWTLPNSSWTQASIADKCCQSQDTRLTEDHTVAFQFLCSSCFVVVFCGSCPRNLWAFLVQRIT